MTRYRVSRAGAYIVRSIDGRSQRVAPKTDGPRRTPTETDRRFVAALLRVKGNRR